MIRPLFDRVVVRRVKEEEKIGTFFIPDSGKEKPARGVVLAVGSGRLAENGTRIAPEVGVGDTVVFGKYSGTETQIGLETLLILREDEIFGVDEPS